MSVLIVFALLIAEPRLSLEETVAQCATLEDDGARLSCFDQIAAAIGAQPPGALSSSEATAETSDAVDPVSPTTGPVASNGNQSDPQPSNQTAKTEQGPQKRFVVLRADDPKLKAAERPGALSGFFRREKYEANVVAFKRNNVGILFVEFDNGEIWRESRARFKGDPKRGEKAIFDPSATGGWFVNFEETDRKTKMRRFDIDN